MPLSRAYNPVEFRLVVFHPFKGEVMFARISSCSPNGIHRAYTAPMHPMHRQHTATNICSPYRLF